MRTRYTYAFPRPSVTATIALLVELDAPEKVGAIIGTRGKADGAYAGFECIPGGFLDAKVDTNDVEIEIQRHAYMSIGEVEENGTNVAELFEDYDIPFEEGKEAEAFNKPGETIEQTAIREVLEETGLTITEDDLHLYHVHSNPNTDPRAHVVNICYFVVLSPEIAATAVAGDDLSAIEVKQFELFDNVGTMAFNHADLLIRAIEHYFKAR